MQTATRAVRSVQRPLARRGIVIRGAIVTRTLVALNVIIYLITVAQGGGINDPGGSLFDKWLLYGPFVANGDWWRLLTACFLHVGIWHIAVNMYALWWLGSVGRGSDRVAALLAALHRLGPGRLCGRAALESERAHGRRLRGDLRDARRRPPARVAGDRAARWAASR